MRSRLCWRVRGDPVREDCPLSRPPTPPKTVESRPSGGGLSRLRLIRGGARPGVAEGEDAETVAGDPRPPRRPRRERRLAAAARAPFRLVRDGLNRVIEP